MKLIKDEITIEELKSMAKARYGDLVKAVVDIAKEVMIVDAELHSDQEKALIESGSDQKDLWGINFYPDLKGEDFIEFDSMINLRPSQGNRSRGVDDEKIQKKIKEIANKLIKDGLPT